jgi:hypothetical protein
MFYVLKVCLDKRGGRGKEEGKEVEREEERDKRGK